MTSLELQMHRAELAYLQDLIEFENMTRRAEILKQKIEEGTIAFAKLRVRYLDSLIEEELEEK